MEPHDPGYKFSISKARTSKQTIFHIIIAHFLRLVYIFLIKKDGKPDKKDRKNKFTTKRKKRLTPQTVYDKIQMAQIVQLIQIGGGIDLKWRFSGKQNVYLEIAEQYREYIRLGVLREGDRLPSVRQAAIELGVNPNTVARAYAHLEQIGAVRSVPKKGIYVAGNADNSQPDCKEALIALRDAGIRKETLLQWIEEVYANYD